LDATLQFLLEEPARRQQPQEQGREYQGIGILMVQADCTSMQSAFLNRDKSEQEWGHMMLKPFWIVAYFTYHSLLHLGMLWL
jgi:hypothetical protein